MKKGFILYKDSLEVLDEMTDEEAGKLFKAIAEYQRGEEPEIKDRAIRFAFMPIKRAFELDEEKYRKKSEVNARNGRKGGLAKKANASETKRTLANANYSEALEFINNLPVFSKAKYKIKYKHLAELNKDFELAEITEIAKKINSKEIDVKNSIATIKNWLQKTVSKSWEEFDRLYPKVKTKNRFEAKLYFEKMSSSQQRKAIDFIKDYESSLEETKFMKNPLEYLRAEIYEQFYNDLVNEHKKLTNGNEIMKANLIKQRLKKYE